MSLEAFTQPATASVHRYSPERLDATLEELLAADERQLAAYRSFQEAPKRRRLLLSWQQGHLLVVKRSGAETVLYGPPPKLLINDLLYNITPALRAATQSTPLRATVILLGLGAGGAAFTGLPHLVPQRLLVSYWLLTGLLFTLALLYGPLASIALQIFTRSATTLELEEATPERRLLKAWQLKAQEAGVAEAATLLKQAEAVLTLGKQLELPQGEAVEAVLEEALVSPEAALSHLQELHAGLKQVQAKRSLVAEAVARPLTLAAEQEAETEKALLRARAEEALARSQAAFQEEQVVAEAACKSLS